MLELCHCIYAVYTHARSGNVIDSTRRLYIFHNVSIITILLYIIENFLVLVSQMNLQVHLISNKAIYRNFDPL